MSTPDPRVLMRAAMQASPAVGAPSDVTPSAGLAQPPGASATAVSGLPSTAGLSNVDLSTLMGTGTDLASDPNAMTQLVQMLQDPATPPDQKAAIQARLQLAAMRQQAGGPSGAVGTPSS